MTIQPHNSFEYTRADEVAECWSGVSHALYARLWCLPKVAIPNIEDSGPFDHVGHDSLASHWKLLTTDEQIALNALAVKQEEELEALMKAVMV